ncbi:MAG: alpha-2-macroglobulin [Bacteroidales bacterium]|nr:alpha-2-macroglobulin [Bacteroidales bacterium]
MRKTVFRSLLLLSAICLVWACGPKKAAPTDTAYAAYIQAYTGGVIPDNASVRLELSNEVPEENRIEEGLFSFSPSVKGTVRWVRPDAVEFIPDDGALKAGTIYTCTFNLGKVVPVAEKALEKFDFGLNVRSAGANESIDESETEDDGVFRVRSARLSGSRITVSFSRELGKNASEKGLVKLDGAARSYITVDGKQIYVDFESRKKPTLTLTVSSHVKDAEGNDLGKDYVATYDGEEPKPEVQLLLSGNILPDAKQLLLPFKAVNLDAVELTVIEIFPDNVMMFLQDNDLAGSEYLRRSGRLVYRQKINLDSSKDLHQWNEHAIDLGPLFQKDPGAIYRIRLSFKKEYSLYGHKEPSLTRSLSSGKPTKEDDETWSTPNSWYWDNDIDWSEYEYSESDNPDKASYYMESERFPYVNLMASRIGLVAKRNQSNKLWVSANEILTAKPLSDVSITAYNYQLQRVAAGRTDSDGFATLTTEQDPFIVVARSGKDVSYLKVSDGSQLSTSRFDVGGVNANDGIKGYIYGERGVWRPGDTLHVTLILRDREGVIPSGHPATLEVYNALGQFHSREVLHGTDGFYTAHIATSPEDPTGFWSAYFKVGGSSFYKTLNVETVKPNRLKVISGLDGNTIQGGSKSVLDVSSNWLTGPPAAGLKAYASMTLRSKHTAFKGFDNYSFNNPAINFSQIEYNKLWSTTLDGSGYSRVAVDWPNASEAPGMLSATIVTSVIEDGGDESFISETVPYAPYPAFVGISTDDKGSYLETDKDQAVRVAVVDKDGKRLSGRKLEYRVFKLKWGWWWQSSGDDLDSYVDSDYAKTLTSGTITSSSKDVSFSFRLDYPDWGRVLILVRDVNGGHVSGKVVTVDWPEYRGRANRNDPEGLSMLTFSTDKESYKVGENVKLFIPAAKNGQAIVSLENATSVISRSRVATSDKDTPFSFKVTEEMAPNFYIYITLIQDYGSTSNDLPLRLYGVQRVSVENPASHLTPELKMPDSLAPEEPFTVQVSEKSGKPMTYTLAIVDEGLLDLTAFKTPDPWGNMYETEALGIRTWDLYDNVVGAFSGRFNPLMAVGGDQDNIVAARKDNRFNPVVKFLGPFTLKRGSDKHKITLPMYVGSVRVMLVAGHEGAYGSCEKAVPVKAPLMLVTSLPRVISAGEKVTMPVNVFSLSDAVKDVNVSISAEGPLKLDGGNNVPLHFKAQGDQIARFSLKAEGTGMAKVTVKAEGNGKKAYETINIEVRNPHPEAVAVVRKSIKAGRSEEFEAKGDATLTIAGFPALDPSQVFIQVRDYPYNCSEQISSRGLTLLHILPMLSDEDAKTAKGIIEELIKSLYSRQKSDGGFGYWSGSTTSDLWVSSMAGIFLTEAEAKGFKVSKGVLASWVKFQKNISNAYRSAGTTVFSELDECYRLYSLALAGQSLTASMNRMKENKNLGYRSAWVLASAYAIGGKVQTAASIIDGLGKNFEDYSPYNLTYGSATRDKSMAIEALTLTNRVAEAIPLAQEVAELFNDGKFSTQETAFAAIALDRLSGKVAGGTLKADVNGKGVSSSKGFLSTKAEGKTSVKNTSDGPIYVTLTSRWRPGAEEVLPALSSGLELSVSYKDNDGNAISPASLLQGTEFTASIKVRNLNRAAGYQLLALEQIVPSGWEIVNERLRGTAAGDSYDNIDIRDDRVQWFFSLPASGSKSFNIKLRAAYEGSYVLPGISCQAMYEPSIAANTASGKAVVTR